jgi:hypothetical protein
MEQWEILIDLLEKSVEKNGERPLTNRWLLNIMRLAEKSANDEEKRSDLEGHRFFDDIY